MKYGVGIWALAALALPWLCGADNSTTPSAENLTAALTTIPSCALPCIVNAVTDAGCSPTDAQCICEDQYAHIQQLGTPCLMSSCDPSDALITKNITERACNKPIRDKSTIIKDGSFVTGIIAEVILITRLVYKRFFSYQRKLSPDDWAITVTFFFILATLVINGLGPQYGTGRDVWTINLHELEIFVRLFYAMEIVYTTTLSITKISLGLFYISIFPGKGIRRLLQGTVIFIAVFGVAITLAIVFQCTPIKYFWEQHVDKNASGHCVNINALAWSFSIVHIVLDIWMLAIPLSQVRKLKLHWKKKIGVMFMFLLGTFVTIVSILRLRTLVTFSDSTNPTYDQVEIALWSTIEQNVGVICTCLPTLRLILVQAAPRVFSTGGSSGRSRGQASNGYEGRSGQDSRVVVHKMVEFTSSTSRREPGEDDEGSDKGIFSKV